MHIDDDFDDLIGSWTLVGSDRDLVGNKTGATRLGFAATLKYFELEARFPKSVEEFPGDAITYWTTAGKVTQ